MTVSTGPPLGSQGEYGEETSSPSTRMAAQAKVSRILSESGSLSSIPPNLLSEISESLGFELAILWKVDEQDLVLVCAEIWHSARVDAPEFVEKTRKVRIPRGSGLPGMVWDSGMPHWVNRSQPDNQLIPPSAVKESIRCAGCIPIKLQDEVLGTIELFSLEERVPDASVQESMLAIGTQIGLFMERNRKAEALRRCEARYRLLADTSRDVLLTIDEEFIISFVNNAVVSTFGYDPSEVIGQNLSLLIPEYHDHAHVLKQPVKTDSPSIVKLPGMHKNGSVLELEVAFSAFQGEESDHPKYTKYATGIITDLTEDVRIHKALHESEQKLHHALTSGAKQMIVAEAPAMRGLIERVKKAAVSFAPILIQGETGSGKECIAHIIHHQSPLAAQPFIARNCAAIPAELFESEMFGHKKGAFTGASHDRKGAFLEANRGTLFLDEIGDMALPLQTKLLRAIQEKVILPVGGDKEIPVNPRIICATNRNLLEHTKDRRFREDLYYRLVTVLLVVPPLRERQEDIIPLARHFIGLASAWTRTLSPDAEQRLLAYDWPGNVRELRSLIEQSVIFAVGNEIQTDELEFPPSTAQAPSKAMADIERRHIMKVLRELNGNKTEAAKVLGLARSTLVLKLKKYREEKGSKK